MRHSASVSQRRLMVTFGQEYLQNTEIILMLYSHSCMKYLNIGSCWVECRELPSLSICYFSFRRGNVWTPKNANIYKDKWGMMLHFKQYLLIHIHTVDTEDYPSIQSGLRANTTYFITFRWFAPSPGKGDLPNHNPSARSVFRIHNETESNIKNHLYHIYICWSISISACSEMVIDVGTANESLRHIVTSSFIAWARNEKFHDVLNHHSPIQ